MLYNYEFIFRLYNLIKEKIINVNNCHDMLRI